MQCPKVGSLPASHRSTSFRSSGAILAAQPCTRLSALETGYKPVPKPLAGPVSPLRSLRASTAFDNAADRFHRVGAYEYLPASSSTMGKTTRATPVPRVRDGVP